MADYEWRLTHHLLPFFRRHRLADITVQAVDRYRQAKVRESRLSAESINKTLTLLGQVLEQAVESDLGHTQPRRALAIYAQAMRRDPGERDRLRALAQGSSWAPAPAEDAAREPAAVRRRQ